MTIQAKPIFDATVPWAFGGCLKCSANFSDLGKEVGIQCVDIGKEDEFLGRFGVCYDCAAQIALEIGFQSKLATLKQLEVAEQSLADAQVAVEIARAAEARSRLDKDTVERLVGPYQQLSLDDELVEVS